MILLINLCCILGRIVVVDANLAGFGGDFGEYLQLLKGNEVLNEFGGGGIDDIGEGQARQEDLMGGEEKELGNGFLRGLYAEKGNPKLDDVHIHFDVNVLVLSRNLSKAKSTEKRLMKFMETDSNSADSKQSGGFDWKELQVRKLKLPRLRIRSN